jgi:hypothetical protein
MAEVHGIGAFLFGWLAVSGGMAGAQESRWPCGHCETGFAIRSG